MTRALRPDELRILAMIEAHHGPQDTAQDAFEVEDDEVCLSVRSQAGTVALVANLSNLAAWHADGTLDDVTLRRWLGIMDD